MYQRILVPLEREGGPEAHMRHVAGLAAEQQLIKDDAFEIAEIMEDEETLDMFHEHLNDETEYSRSMKARLLALRKGVS